MYSTENTVARYMSICLCQAHSDIASGRLNKVNYQVLAARSRPIITFSQD